MKTQEPARPPSVRLVDPSKDERWDAFLDRAARSSVFHHSLWKAVIERSFPARPLYLAVEDDANTIKWGMPFFLKKSMITGNALISLPFSDYCDILSADEEEFRILWNKALGTAEENGAHHIEIRTRAGQGVDLEKYSLERRRTYLNHRLEITGDLDYMEKKVIERSYKYDIRQAVKNGVTCRSATGGSDMKRYYGLYLMTRTRHGLPPMPYAFFRNVWEVLSPAKMVYLFLAYWEEVPIAGIVFLRHGRCLYALSNSSDGRFLDKKPNHLLWWKGIQLAVELGLNSLDFGRTSLDNKGLRFFKKRWGTEELEIHHYRYDIGRAGRGNGPSRPADVTRALPAVLKRLPPWALRAAGDIAYRRLCLW